MKVIEIEPDSLATAVGIKPGDDIRKINGHIIRDTIDYRFYRSDEYLEIEYYRSGIRHSVSIEKEFDQDLGIIFEDIRYKCCGNKCIFCFIDQNPAGMRSGLYLKDEDYRLSFIYGNYVTLTNISRRALDRIVEQRLSPLYISVHSTDTEIRKQMLGIKKDDRLLEKIDFLARHGIELHTQIVLCPGFNDGESLEKTINDLSGFYPFLQSIAIVPVGLTRHRQNLPKLQPVSADYARQFIPTIERVANSFKHKIGDYLLYLADEFYILSGQNLPPMERYENFPQIENGVGMTRSFIDLFEEQTIDFPHRISQQRSMLLVTGKLAAPILQNWVIPRLNKIENLKTDLQIIENQFYGNSVTVTGLLTGQDIYQQIAEQNRYDVIVLPANCLNYDGIFLDNLSPQELQNKLQRQIEIVDNDFVELIERIK
ncbi:MAG TPA: DUF512 domain-containing protein [bacterium]|nr:DUF512 domain-containing protein [bacterium]